MTKNFLTTSDEKFIRKMEEEALLPHSSEYFGRRNNLSVAKTSCEMNCADEDNLLVTKNDPRNRQMTTIGRYSWEENGFHITSRP